MTQQKKNYALPIIMMILLFGMISFVTNLAAPMGVVVKGQFQASNFMGMLGNFANFIAYAFMGIPAGMMLKKIIRDYNQESGATIFISSHNLQHTVDLSTRVVLLEHGVIIKDLSNSDGSAEKELEDYFRI